MQSGDMAAILVVINDVGGGRTFSNRGLVAVGRCPLASASMYCIVIQGSYLTAVD